jgi:hypothetical protein
MSLPRLIRAPFVVLALLASVLPSLSAAAADSACLSGVKERMNLAIGLYRIEVAASHMIGQTAAAANNPGRLQQLDNARDGLKELKIRLRSRADELLADGDAKGRCVGADAALLAPIHAALSTYFQTVDARWSFMERRLEDLRRLPAGKALPPAPEEVDLWMHEPLARYEVWRTLARTVKPQGEMASALYVVGMLTRFEWDTAVALRDALKGERDPRASLRAAAEDVATLRRSWPQPDGEIKPALWLALAETSRALPDPSSSFPDPPPPGGWAPWIGEWIKPYGEVFTRNVSGMLKAMEEVGLE